MRRKIRLVANVMGFPASVIVTVMRRRTMCMIMVVVILVIGAMPEFRFDSGMADAVLGRKPFLDGADGGMGIDPVIEAGVQRRHVG